MCVCLWFHLLICLFLFFNKFKHLEKSEHTPTRAFNSSRFYSHVALFIIFSPMSSLIISLRTNWMWGWRCCNYFIPLLDLMKARNEILDKRIITHWTFVFNSQTVYHKWVHVIMLTQNFKGIAPTKMKITSLFILRHVVLNCYEFLWTQKRIFWSMMA